ncbi:MAG TPA: hypothetical protein VMF08_12970 [Candidatus Sulfotelmatobacter sp.]|nr:hypothetical protein [Candidatus Sulfotelmatobacter sp.]
MAGSIFAFTAASRAQPYSNFIADQFDSDTTASLQNQGWGSAVPIITWATNNAITTMGPNNPGSGSAEFQIAWPNPSGDQVMVANWFDGSGDMINLNDYTNVSFDIMFPTNCGTDGNGSYGVIEIGCIPYTDGWPSTALGDYTSAVTNGNGWIHVSFALDAASVQKEDQVEGYYFKVQQSATSHALTNTVFYVDNIIFGGLDTQPPPPVLTIRPNKPLTPGLMIVCGGNGGTYTRGLMAALDTVNSTRNFSWINSGSTPVTYSQTIVNYPGTNDPIQSAIFLVENGNLGDPGVDYDAANVAELNVYGNANGTATASFEYKTNDPDDSSEFGNNTLATLTAPSPLGTWSATFLDDTNLTISYTPLGGGATLTTNANFPGEAQAQYFANPLTVFMGNDEDGYLGQSSTYSEFKISGVTASAPLDDVWSSQMSMDTTNWAIVDYSANDIILVKTNSLYWISWPLPATGFSLAVSTNLAAGPDGWTDAGLSTVVSTSTNDEVLWPDLSTNYPAGANVSFILINRAYTQLQVLLPGETNAPGTATGYIGSPTPESVDTPFPVTINACDATWHIVSTAPGDTISLSSSTDPAFEPGNSAALVNGTVQIDGLFGTSGSQTVTATDTSNNKIPSGQSASVTVQ